MGSEDLFHKRKAKETKALARKKEKRASYDKVLIVCEGEKTEPNYFNELKQHFEINSANIAVDGSCGSSPKSVLQRAEQLYKVEERKGDPFDRVYCVFDKDSHETYDATIEKIKNKRPKNVFIAAVSVPSFEYWLLLHFNYTTQPYAATEKLSTAGVVLKQLKKYMPEYEKGQRDVFNSLFDKLQFATANAVRAKKQAESNHSDNPSTTIHELVSYLADIN